MLKKNTATLFFIAIISMNLSYGQSFAKSNREEVVKVLRDSLPICEFDLNEEEAKKMISYYDMLFDSDGLTKEFWMSKCLVNTLANFLKNNPSFDGINFSLGAKRKFLGKLNSKIILVLTTEASTQNEIKKHNNEWGSFISLSTNCNSDVNIFINEGKGNSEKWINKFGEDFRGESNFGDRFSAKKGPLSIAVWMKACKIMKINEIINANHTLDGLMVKAASYYKSDEMFQRKERKYEIQSTMIFIPTINGKIDWTDLRKLSLVKTTATDVYNHGSLCPQICD